MIESTDDIANAYILFDVDEVRPGQSDADTTINIFVSAAVPLASSFKLSSGGCTGRGERQPGSPD